MKQQTRGSGSSRRSVAPAGSGLDRAGNAPRGRRRPRAVLRRSIRPRRIDQLGRRAATLRAGHDSARWWLALRPLRAWGAQSLKRRANPRPGGPIFSVATIAIVVHTFLLHHLFLGWSTMTRMLAVWRGEVPPAEGLVLDHALASPLVLPLTRLIGASLAAFLLLETTSALGSDGCRQRKAQRLLITAMGLLLLVTYDHALARWAFILAGPQ